MSGVSLSMAPRTEPDQTISKRHHHQQPPALGEGVMGSLRVIELQLVAFIMVFSLSGLVPLIDLIFPAFTSAYLLLLSRFVFPAAARGDTTTATTSQEIFQGSRLFRMYIVTGAVIGLFLPLAYVLGAFARGDQHTLRSVTPLLFLLSFQILTENIISGFGLFSLPVRAFVPVIYTVRRLFVILEWVQDVWVYKSLPANAQPQDVGWIWFGRSLAVANLIYFSTNLLGFLIPRFLPRAFERYFKERDEHHQVMADHHGDDKDKPSSTAANTSSASSSHDSHHINKPETVTTGTKKSD